MKTQNASSESRSKRFPYWLRQSVKENKGFNETRELISKLGLNTVCRSARCPNIHDCFSVKRCTFLILGKSCTRSCGFCAVEKNRLELRAPDKEELLKIKEAVEKLDIKNVVITSVTRDDMVDGGANYFADCIDILKSIGRGLKIEALVPDFFGKKCSIEKVVSARPDIFSHNLETVPRLYGKVRPGADYNRSLEVLRYAKELDNSIATKSGIMAGLGEFREEIRSVMKDLRKADCDIITIGQYLKPDAGCLKVEEFLEPAEFSKFSGWAKEAGFKKYYCGPFVRSSYTEGIWQS
ncbi:MAG: lipoyl synthase [Candidatus Omnitrophica bacterium]|nr:lipoyl synthase [Candidatus Omnitrophota bacterium]